MSNSKNRVFSKKKSLTELLASDQFFVSAELTPPRHYDLEDFMRSAEILDQYVDVLQINDHLLSKARINNLIAGQHCLASGIDPVLQFTLRHKNRIAVQGDLLGMAASGLKHIIVLSGYPCSINTDYEAADVFDLTTIEAIQKISNLTTRGELFNGEIIWPPPSFTLGTIEFPCEAKNLEISMDRLEKKINAGATFIQIQAVFEVETLQRWMQAVVEKGLHKRAKFIGAIFPFTTVERLNVLSEIPGLEIPDWIINRINDHNVKKESLVIMLELIKGIKEIEGISGLHIRSIGLEEWVPKIIEASGLGGEFVY